MKKCISRVFRKKKQTSFIFSTALKHCSSTTTVNSAPSKLAQHSKFNIILVTTTTQSWNFFNVSAFLGNSSSCCAKNVFPSLSLVMKINVLINFVYNAPNFFNVWFPWRDFSLRRDVRLLLKLASWTSSLESADFILFL